MPGDQEDPSSNSVYGFRTYRFFPTTGPVEFFCGGELSYLAMQPLDDGVAVTSFAGRGFLGVQLAVRRVRIGADIGPYLMGLGREIGLSPVLRTYLSVQLF